MNKKILKLMSLILAVLSLSGYLNMLFYGLDNSTGKAEDSSVSSKSNEKGTWDKIKDHLKNNVALYSVSAAATITTTLLLLMNNASKSRYNSLSNAHRKLCHDYDTLLSMYDNYSTVSVPVPYVPADVWFERLGGTQNDIDSYEPYDAAPYVPTSDELNTRKYKQIYQISADVNRYPPEAFMRNSRSEKFKIKFNHILDKFYTEHENIDYTQGWDYILYMIYRKFMEDRSNKNRLLSREDEAKVYFIYSKFMEMIGGKYNNSDWQKYADDLAKSFFNTKRYDCNLVEFERIMFSSDMAPYNRQMIFLHGVFMGGTRLLGFSKATLIWDYIILNNHFVSPQGFNPETLDAVNNIMFAYIGLHVRDQVRDLYKPFFPNGIYEERLSLY